MKKVIVESPYAGDIALNTRYARACIKHCLMNGEAPLASHLLYTQDGILDDTVEAERALGIEAGLVWAKEADLTAVYTDLGISGGMKLGIQRAELDGRPIEYREIDWSGDQK